ncbi:MAG: TfuA-like protein [Acidimicrobiales bacterium]
MTVIAFVGPSLCAQDAATACPGVEVRPPASRGDILRAAEEASVIAIVDGYYEHLPSVWHKEVLHALARGCHVVGGGSMGAIRAAELAPFGMVGVGRIYGRFADGTYGDADVSLAHGPGPDYRSSSEPFANVHATVEAATGNDIITADTEARLLDAARALFYADRTYDAIVRRARALAPDDRFLGDELDRFSSWWPTNAIDQKRLDAVAVLRHAAGLVDVPAPEREFVLAETHFFQAMVREEAAIGHNDSVDRHAHPILEEVRLRPELHATAHAAALTDALAEDVARSHGVVLTQHLLDEASDRIRRRLGLGDVADLERWLADNGLGWDDYAELARRRALIEWAVDHVARGGLDEQATIDWLRLSGRYESLAERSRTKAATLRAAGLDEAGASDHLASDQEALEWWRSSLAADLGSVDPLTATGFASLEELARAARRERSYLELQGRLP